MCSLSKSSCWDVGELKTIICITDMNIGIYKWVSPSGRIYVGQSTNIKQRKEWYLSGGINKASMPKLKHSFEKYGVENHIFEEIEYCSIESLNEREIYWGLYYDTLNTGLNCKLGEQNCIFSNSTKDKMSEAKKGTIQTEQQKIKRKESTSKTWKKKMEDGFKRKYWKQTEEGKQKISNAQKGKTVSKETRQKISESLEGKPKTEEHKQNLSKAKKGKTIHTKESKRILSEYGKNRDLTKTWEAASKARSKPIFQYDIYDNLIKEWNSSSEAEYFYNNKKGDNIRQTIRYFIKTGIQRKAYGFIWKENY
jgi:group I intron endonuclease